jgi:hypothetical protein
VKPGLHPLPGCRYTARHWYSKKEKIPKMHPRFKLAARLPHSVRAKTQPTHTTALWFKRFSKCCQRGGNTSHCITYIRTHNGTPHTRCNRAKTQVLLPCQKQNSKTAGRLDAKHSPDLAQVGYTLLQQLQTTTTRNTRTAANYQKL